MNAGVAQLVEQLICNQQVGGSNPFASSSVMSDPPMAELTCSLWADAGVGEPGRTVNPLADAFGGSNPSPPT